MNSPMLKSCPFCGGEEFNRVRPSSIHVQVHCDSCAARGPAEHTEASAIAAWNARPDTPARPDREAVARIIDPLAWASSRKPGEYMLSSHVRDTALAKADAILALLPPADGWRSIDTAPRDGTWVFLYSARWPIWAYPMVGWSDGPGEEWMFPEHPQWAPEMPYPSHWMPLPPAPPAAVGDE